MSSRWSMGVVVAIAVVVLVALGSQAAPETSAKVENPLRVTIALQTDGVELRVAQGHFVLTLEI